MIQLVTRGLDIVAHLLCAVSAVLVAAILGLVTVSVVMRYALTTPFRFTEELVGILVLASVFLALPLVRLQGRDINVTAVTDLLPRRIALAASYFARLVILLFLVLFGWDVSKQFQFALNRKLATEVSRLPIWPWLVVMLISLVLVAAVTVVAHRKNKS